MATTSSSNTSVKTPYQNAVQFLNYANTYLQAQDVRDDDGNIMQYTQLAGAAEWIFALAAGTMATEWQERLRDAESWLDISSCSNERVLDLAVVAGVTRSQGTTSRITAGITNSSSSPVTLSKNTAFKDPVNGQYWYTELQYVIPANQSMTVSGTLSCASKGAYEVSIGDVLTNDTYTYITVTCTACKTGDSAETISQLRNRIINGAAAQDPITQCETAIKALSGISDCKVNFNPSTTQDKVLDNGIVIPPRSAYLTITGTDINDQIAKAYYTYMSVPTVNPGTETSGQSTILRGTDELTVYYDVSKQQVCFIRIIVGESDSNIGADQLLKAALLNRVGLLSINEALTEIMVASWISSITAVKCYAADVSAATTVTRDVYNVVEPEEGEDPSALGYYEYDDATADYVLTQDTEVVEGKTYYQKSTEEVLAPVNWQDVLEPDADAALIWTADTIQIETRS